ncbi:MAG: hypothetical protein LH468_03190 [Nocardioides sp.]|nr:hypothetical protein [Nocardioides sp.]
MVLTKTQLTVVGTDEPVRGEIRVTGFDRIAHGLYLRRRTNLSPDDAFRRELVAWMLVLPPGAVFTHITAARLRGWTMPKLPEQVPVFAAIRGTSRGPRRPGLICSRLTHPSDVVRSAPLPTDTAPEILLRAARDLGVLDLVIMIDSAVHVGDLDPADMERLLVSGRPGVRRLHDAYVLSDARSESGGETLLRCLHEVARVVVTPQVELHDEEGRFIARADLLVAGTRTLHEYDGAHHRTVAGHRGDLRRDRRLLAAGYQRRGYTLDDLTNHPTAVFQDLDRLTGRRHDPVRLRAWRRMLTNSLYEPVGRERVMNRWHRANGLIDWSGTASLRA